MIDDEDVDRALFRLQLETEGIDHRPHRIEPSGAVLRLGHFHEDLEHSRKTGSVDHGAVGTALQQSGQFGNLHRLTGQPQVAGAGSPNMVWHPVPRPAGTLLQSRSEIFDRGNFGPFRATTNAKTGPSFTSCRTASLKLSSSSARTRGISALYLFPGALAEKASGFRFGLDVVTFIKAGRSELLERRRTTEDDNRR